MAADTAQSFEERKLALEQRKLDSDDAFRRAELEIKRREIGWAARLFSPLTATLFAGILAIVGSVVATQMQGANTLRLEREKFESSKTLETQSSSTN